MFFGKMWGTQAQRSLGCGELTVSCLDIHLRSLNSRSQELQRGQRELPSGQSLQFSPSALPRPHRLAACKETGLDKKQCWAGWNLGRQAASMGKETCGPNFLQNYQEEARGRGKNLFPQSCIHFCPVILLLYHQYSVVRIPECCVI